MSDSFDIAIVGGGIAGLSLAYFLRGCCSVVVLERETQLGYHSSGRSSSEFSLRFHTPLVGELTKAGRSFLEHPPVEFSETPLITRRGNLLIAGPEKAARLRQVFAEECERLAGLLLLSAPEAARMAPILDPGRIAGAIHDPDCWDIDTARLLNSYRRGASAFGAEIRTGAELIRASYRSGAWTIETTPGGVRASVIVNASGAWADTVAERCGHAPLSLTPYRRTAVLVDLPEDIEAQSLPEINEIDEAYYFKPDGGRLMISPADASQSVACDAAPEELDIAWAVHHLEQVTRIKVVRIAHRWAGLRTFARDRKPVVGFSDVAQSFFWLAGQGGYGIQTSPGLGWLAASLLLETDRPREFEGSWLTSDHMTPGRLT